MLLKCTIRVYATYQLTFSTLRYHNTLLTFMDIMTCSLKQLGKSHSNEPKTGSEYKTDDILKLNMIKCWILLLNYEVTMALH
jgi:hypothetical protein